MSLVPERESITRKGEARINYQGTHDLVSVFESMEKSLDSCIACSGGSGLGLDAGTGIRPTGKFLFLFLNDSKRDTQENTESLRWWATLQIFAKHNSVYVSFPY
jgi:hypothetical protein